MVTSHSHRYVSLFLTYIIALCTCHLRCSSSTYLLYGYIIASSFLFIVLSTPKYFVCLYLIYCCYFSATSHASSFHLHRPFNSEILRVRVFVLVLAQPSLQISIHSAVGNKMLLSACKYILMGGMVKGDMPGGLGSMGLTMSDGMGGGCMNGG